jgi:hypothetical protein
MMGPFRAGATVTTGLGTPVFILAILPEGEEVNNGRAIIGIIRHRDGSRDLGAWFRDGRSDDGGRCPRDLQLPKPVLRTIDGEDRILKAGEVVMFGKPKERA